MKRSLDETMEAQSNCQSNDLVTVRSEDAVKDSTLDQTIFEMNWQTKMRITRNLDELSWCLYKKRAPDTKKDALISEIYELFKILVNLPAQSQAPRRDPKSFYKRVKREDMVELENEEETESNRDIPLLVPWTIRDAIVDSLMRNHYVLTNPSVNPDEKVRLRTKIFKLSQILNELNVSPIAEIDLENDYESDLDSPINSTALTNNSSKEQKPNIKEIYEALQMYPGLLSMTSAPFVPAETQIEFKFSLITLKESRVLLGSSKQFREMEWRVKVAIKEMADQSESLGIFLVLDTPGYECQGTMDIKLHNHANDSFNLKHANIHFTKPSARGVPNYLPISALTEESGLVKDDIVTVMICFKIQSCQKI